MRVTGGFPHKGQVTRSFGAFFVVCLDTLLGEIVSWRFGTHWRSNYVVVTFTRNDLYRSNTCSREDSFLIYSTTYKSSPLSHNAMLAFWCFYNRNRKNTVGIRWLKSVDYVQIYNAVNSEQPAAKADLYPLPVVLLASPAREPSFWL